VKPVALEALGNVVPWNTNEFTRFVDTGVITTPPTAAAKTGSWSKLAQKRRLMAARGLASSGNWNCAKSEVGSTRAAPTINSEIRARRMAHPPGILPSDRFLGTQEL